MDSIFSPLFIIPFIILIYSAILHEIAHGYIADRLGDPTARLLGRITLNPIPHIDPFFTILLPLMLFLLNPFGFIIGGAKPVPVDPFNLKEGRKDMAIVSLAGPLTNLVLAVLGTAIFKLLFTNYSFLEVVSRGFFPQSPMDLSAFILANIIQINLMLAVFNLLPIPPLDGSKVFSLILPENLANAYLSVGQFGIFILFFFLMSSGGGMFLSTIYGFLLEFLGLLAR